MNEIEQVIEKIESLKNLLGWTGAITGLLLFLGIYFIWKYLNKAIEKSAEITSEKTIKKFQAQLDKELFSPLQVFRKSKRPLLSVAHR